MGRKAVNAGVQLHFLVTVSKRDKKQAASKKHVGWNTDAPDCENNTSWPYTVKSNNLVSDVALLRSVGRYSCRSPLDSCNSSELLHFEQTTDKWKTEFVTNIFNLVGMQVFASTGMSCRNWMVVCSVLSSATAEHGPTSLTPSVLGFVT